MSDWFFYHLPIWVSLPVFVVVFVALSWLILLGVRPWVQRASAADSLQWDRVLGYAMSSYGIFYGILLGLIAVSVYENFQRINGEVLDEVEALATLYRNTDAFPAPIAQELSSLLATYTIDVVNVDWPSQANGVIPTAGDATVNQIQSALYGIQPTSLGENSIFAQTLQVWADFQQYRRGRLEETELVLPPLLWAVVAIGSVLNALMISLVEIRSLRVHLIMAGIIATFVALLIYTIASMDHAYAGPVSVDPEPFLDLYLEIMR